jgi:hypothetical protein
MEDGKPSTFNIQRRTSNVQNGRAKTFQRADAVIGVATAGFSISDFSFCPCPLKNR